MLIQNTSDIGWTNKFVWEVLPDEAWEGNPCFIIGGGTSLKTFDWSLLKGHLTIGINRAFEAFDPTIIFTMDRAKFLRWVLNGRYGEEARKKFINTKSIKVVLCTSRCSLPLDMYVVKAWHGFVNSFNAFPFSTKDGIGHGSNSGYGALNLAACLGANPIYLLGFDMYYDGAKTHWHSGHPKRQPPNALPKYIKFMSIAAEKLKNTDIKVINLNPESNLNCFEKAGIDTVFKNARLYMPEKKSMLPICTQPSIEKKEITTEEQTGIKVRPAGAPFGTAIRISDFVKMIKPTKDIYIIGPYGFGDTFYLRPLVRHLTKNYRHIYIRTTIPEVFWDFPSVRFVRPPPNRLKHQEGHIEHIDKSKEYKWTKPPNKTEQKAWTQITSSWKIRGGTARPTGKRGEESTTRYIEIENSITNFDFSFNLKPEWIEEARKIIVPLKIGRKKICIIRQPAVNKTWPCLSRNPKLEYFQILIDKYKKDYYFISIGSNVKGYEDYTGKLKGINRRFDKGELPLTTIFALIKLSDMMITFPAFFAVVAIALRAKCFCIFGGCTKPGAILNKNMGLENFEHVAPRPFCNCMLMDHNCNKEIPKKEIFNKFRAFRMKRTQKIKQKENGKEVSIGVPAGLGDIHWILTKLQSFKEKNCIDKLKLVIPGDGQNRSDGFVRLIPFIDSVEIRKTNFSPNLLYSQKAMEKNWHDRDYAFGFNYLLEQGIKLTDILPEYKTDFNYPILYPLESKKFAEELKKKVGGKLFLLYGSNRGMFRLWTGGKWLALDWVKLANYIFQTTGCNPILIGAHWDSDYSKDILREDKDRIIYDLVSQTDISQVFALIREANILIGFPSGLTILATHFRTPCVMFWSIKGITPDKKRGWFKKEFMTSWVNPEILKKGEYLPFAYGNSETTPEGVFDAIRRFL